MKTNLLKSIFISLILVLGVSNAWGATTATLYYSVPASTVGCYTVKCYYNFGYGQTGLVEMTKVDKTSNGNLIYSVKLTANNNNVDNLLFQLFDGDTWKSEQQVMSGWKPLADNDGKMYVHNTGWNTYSTDASYTVYFVNKDSWSGTIKAYAWNSNCDYNATWSGASMTSTGKTYKGKNIYSITLNKRYANIIFNNGSSQTDDLTLGSTNIGKMFDGSSWVDYNVDPVVTFKANGGTGSDYTQTVKYNTSTALTANKFTRTGYSFNGWKTAANSGTSYANQASVKFTANTTLYAQWTPNQYTITYKDQGGSNFSGTNKANLPAQHTYGTATTLVNGVKTGFNFDGWFTTQDCTGSAVTSLGATAYTANITLYAKWTIIEETKYDVIISSAGNGKVEPSGTQKVGASGIDVTATANTGYKFKQWSYTAGATANPLNTETTLVTATGNGTVTASFEEILYDITITSNNAAYGDVNPKSAQAGIATKVAITASPAEGYEFVNWTAPSSITLENANNASTTITKATAKGTVSAKFQEKKYNITVLKDGKNSTTQQIGAKTQVSITAATLTGFEFVGWVVSDEQTPGCITIDDPTKATIKVTATGTGTITATFRETGVLYFKNNLGWSEVYVYFHTSDSYWDATLGSGSYGLTIANGRAFKMERIGNTDIYKCHYGAKGTVPTNSLAFTPENKENNSNFWRTKASYRTDFNSQMELFIPQNTKTETKNETDYYSSGIWMKYNSTESGYKWSSDQNGWSTDVNPFTASTKGGYTFTTTVTLSGNTTYLFKVNNIKGDWYSKVCTITQDECTNLWFQPESDPNKNAVIKPNVAGDYVFTLYLGDGKVELSLEYPLIVGDYRLSYYDAVTGLHPGHYIKKRNEDRRDTVSFFVHVENNPEIRLERCTNIDANTSTATWEILDRYEVLKTSGADPTSAQLPGKRKSDAVLYAGEGCGIDSTGVYNFILQQSNSTAEVITDETHPYVGDFYIRTDAADGGWDAFRQQSNKITYSSFADSHSNFNHYYCKYIEAGSNVKFTIANDYSYCISDTLDNDAIILPNQSSVGCLPINANVRFGWDSNTNEISRAYIKGAGMTSDRFLVLQGKDDNLRDANGDVLVEGVNDTTRYGLQANEEILVDQQNWIYQVDVTANNATQVKLIAEYNGTTQYFKGNETEYTGLLSSTASDTYKIRLVYDFKSNHLIIGWLAGGNTVEGEHTLGADMMVIRRDQQPADQLNFDPTASPLKEVGIGYAVMTFTKAHLENLEADNETPLPENRKKTERERSLYWVSFPFDVKISDVFGFGEYAEHWILQYYDGAERAEKGLFNDSGTYWKYIFDTDTELKAGQGYVLVLDLNKVEFLHGATEVNLYFPSTGKLTTITGELPTTDTVPAHECTIDREWTESGTTYHHKYTDSHWNLIGVPGFADITGFDVTKYHFMQDDASFYYNFNLANSTYTVENDATNFQAMYAYMVQFAGTINWMTKAISNTPEPETLAARRYSDDQPEKVALRLELAQGEEVADRTFVQLQQEGATANFDLSLDLTKIVNIGVSNIYTLTDSLKIQTAGNVLPFEETTVAVGVDIATAGEYTFRMPDGTEGMVIELIDYETNTTTNLLLDDYTVNLPAGSNETRFALSLKPEKTATSIENTTTPSDSNIRKFIIDGKLYLQKDGMLYDAQGKLVR